MTIAEVFETEWNDMLGEIETEIEQIPSYLTEDGRRMIRRVSVYRIIDKYKAESNKRTRMSKEQIKAINDFWKEYTGRELYKDADN